VAAVQAQPPAEGGFGDGHRWVRMAEDEKLAFLEGFLAASGYEQGLRLGLRRVTPAALEQLRSDGRLSLPYAPNVYKARLDDYFFYTNRRSIPLYRAVHELNDQIRESMQHP
jgi:hypothetical protein